MLKRTVTWNLDNLIYPKSLLEFKSVDIASDFMQLTNPCNNPFGNLPKALRRVGYSLSRVDPNAVTFVFEIVAHRWLQPQKVADEGSRPTETTKIRHSESLLDVHWKSYRQVMAVFWKFSLFMDSINLAVHWTNQRDRRASIWKYGFKAAYKNYSTHPVNGTRVVIP